VPLECELPSGWENNVGSLIFDTPEVVTALTDFFGGLWNEVVVGSVDYVAWPNVNETPILGYGTFADVRYQAFFTPADYPISIGIGVRLNGSGQGIYLWYDKPDASTLGALSITTNLARTVGVLTYQNLLVDFPAGVAFGLQLNVKGTCVQANANSFSPPGYTFRLAPQYLPAIGGVGPIGGSDGRITSSGAYPIL
jgi:hypothetical protein